VTGIKMAIAEVNAAGGALGKQIELVDYDNKSDATESTSIASKLMEQDGVVACLGPATSGCFKATIPIAEQIGVPVISASATSDKDITVNADGTVNDHVFRICFTDSFQGTTMANFAKDTLSAKTAVIYKDTSSDYAKGLAETFRATFEANGGTIVAEEAYTNKDSDFRAVLTSIQANQFDVIFCPGYYEQAGLIIAQARELGIAVPILGADGFDSPVLLDLAGADALSDVYFSNLYSSIDQDPKVQEFIPKFQAAHNNEAPNAFNALGYDLGLFIADAITRAGSADAQAVHDAIASTSNFEGVTGSFKMGADHNPIRDGVVVEMQGGEQVNAIRVKA